MAYTDRNFKKRKELKEAFLRGERIALHQPGPFGPAVKDGVVFLEGPHYPAPHSWYAKGEARNGELVKLDGLTKAEQAARASALSVA